MNKFCVNCGSSLQSGSAFCTNCGTKIEVINEYPVNTNNVVNGNSNLNAENLQGINQEVQNIGYNQSNNNINQVNNNNSNNINQSINMNQVNNNNSNNINQSINMNQVNNNSKSHNNKGLKIASLVLGIVAILGSFILSFLVIPLAIVGLILGIVYSAKVKKVCAGIFLNIIGFLMPFILLLIAFFTFGTIFYNAVDDNINDVWNDTDYDSSYDDDYSDDYDDYFTDDTYNTTNSEFQRVGSEEYGYISVPNNWSPFYDINNTEVLQYSYANIWIMTMLAVDNETKIPVENYANILETTLNNDGCLHISKEKVKVGKYDAYKVSGYYSTENKWLVTWSFIDENNKLHYIAIEGPDKDSEHFDLIDTFSLVK